MTVSHAKLKQSAAEPPTTAMELVPSYSHAKVVWRAQKAYLALQCSSDLKDLPDFEQFPDYDLK